MARKTASQIEKDVYRTVKRCLGNIIGGKVYRRGTRPADSQDEDCEVVFASGAEGQKQNGEVYVHLYIPYINAGRRSVMIPNIARIDELEIALEDMLTQLGMDSEYLFGYRYTPTTIDVDEIKQSQLSALITYQRYTF